MTDCTEHLQQLALVSGVGDAAAIHAVLSAYEALQARVRELEAERDDWAADALLDVRHRLARVRLDLLRTEQQLNAERTILTRLLDMADAWDTSFGDQPLRTPVVTESIRRTIKERP